AACPVLVVPEDMRIAKRIRKITYATDYLESDLKDFRKVAELARPLDAELCLMHISEDEHKPEREVAEFHRFLEEAGRRIDYRKLSAELLTGPDVALRLREYLEAEKTDLLVMSTRRRRLLSRIFEPGLTKKMIRLEQVPVVVF